MVPCAEERGCVRGTTDFHEVTLELLLEEEFERHEGIVWRVFYAEGPACANALGQDNVQACGKSREGAMWDLGGSGFFL